MTTRSTWQPWLATAEAPLYQRLALALRHDVASGLLAPGTRLPTHRELARALGTTLVTASRAYREAAALGLVEATVGRGTFVAASSPAAGVSAGSRGAPGDPDSLAGVAPGSEVEAGGGLIELTANYISLPSLFGPPISHLPARATPAPPASASGAALAADAAPATPRAQAVSASAAHATDAALWARLLLDGLTRRYPPGGSAAHREAAAAWLERDGWAPRAAEIVATAGAQHAILVILAALARPDGPVYVEELTYHGILPAARTLGLHLLPVALDHHGLVPRALAARCADRPPGGLLFCQPALHNPTSSVMPLARRQELAQVCRRHDLAVVEDCVYEFLLPAPPPPLAALLPERTCHIVSGAKVLAPGLRTGYIAAPEAWVPRLQAEVAATALNAAAGLLDLAARWMSDGTAARLVEARRQEAARRQEIAALRLAAPPTLTASNVHTAQGPGTDLRTHPASCHLWLELPAPWTSAAFVEQARRRGVAVHPAAAFAVDRSTAPAAVRICLGSPADARLLDDALARLAALLTQSPPPEEPVI